MFVGCGDCDVCEGFCGPVRTSIFVDPSKYGIYDPYLQVNTLFMTILVSTIIIICIDNIIKEPSLLCHRVLYYIILYLLP